MAKVTKIYASRQPNRPHYIQAWAESQKMLPKDLASELGADKSLVSRWYSGTSPTKDYQIRLAALFTKDSEFPVVPEDLYKPPTESWITKKLKKHKEIQDFLLASNDERLGRLQQLIALSFPKDGTNG